MSHLRIKLFNHWIEPEPLRAYLEYSTMPAKHTFMIILCSENPYLAKAKLRVACLA